MKDQNITEKIPKQISCNITELHPMPPPPNKPDLAKDLLVALKVVAGSWEVSTNLTSFK